MSLPYFYTWCGPSANLQFRYEIINVLHAARCKCRTQKVAKNRHLGTIAQLCRAISLQLRHVLTIGKKLLSTNISSTCPHNMVNFVPLAAEIVSLEFFSEVKYHCIAVTRQKLLMLLSLSAHLNSFVCQLLYLHMIHIHICMYVCMYVCEWNSHLDKTESCLHMQSHNLQRAAMRALQALY